MAPFFPTDPNPLPRAKSPPAISATSAPPPTVPSGAFSVATLLQRYSFPRQILLPCPPLGHRCHPSVPPPSGVYRRPGQSDGSSSLRHVLPPPCNVLRRQATRGLVDISQYGQVSEIQSKLYEEIAGVMGRHPQSHFVLPHLATEEVELEAYVVPKNATINFMAADLGWDPKVWKDLMEFKPDRFILMNKDDVFDITRNKEIKMMPFGAGKRICPSFGLPILHLEYFVANLV
ncbi:hypothetical protein LguiB_020571 [Lonicera macranthoides]